MVGFHEKRPELAAPPFVAAGGERAKCVAVIALPAGDDVPALRLALFDEILPGHLQGRLDGFRTAAHQIDVIETVGRMSNEIVGEFLGDVRGEEAGMRVGQLIQLLVKGRQHVRMAVAEAGHGGAARSVDIGLAGGIEEFDALAADGDRHGGIGIAMQKMGHDDLLVERD